MPCPNCTALGYTDAETGKLLAITNLARYADGEKRRVRCSMCQWSGTVIIYENMMFRRV